MKSKRANHHARTSRRKVTGTELWQKLGYNNARAYQRARQQGKLPIRTFPMPGSRGYFAYECDLLELQQGRNRLKKDDGDIKKGQ